MASLAGIISQHGKVECDCTDKIRKMLETMRHRGPDNTVIRTLFGERGAVGADEVNLTPRTTFSSRIEDYPLILFDGELYNERENDQTDIQLLTELFETYEEECFSMLDGNFAIAIIKKNDEVILARDNIGARPLFYAIDNNTFYFSSEMKGLADYVMFNVQELKPGQIFSNKKGLDKFTPYMPEVPEPTSDIKIATQILRELIIEAVEERMDGVEAVALSGGLDSSIIAAIAKKYNSNLKLFTAGLKEADSPDLENAKLMAEFLGLEHHIYLITNEDIENFISDAVWHLESFDGDQINGMIANFYTSKFVKEHSNIVMVGEGADELFGGYRLVLKSDKVKNDQHRERLAKRLIEIAYNTALSRLDRGWLANSVSYRIPFLDSKVVEFSKKIPMNWKIYGENQVEKYILRNAFRDMLPEKIANREKLRFSMGVGVEDVMNDIMAKKIDPKELENRPKAAYGMPFDSFKELYYYDEFLRKFPPYYETLITRWDPFK